VALSQGEGLAEEQEGGWLVQDKKPSSLTLTTKRRFVSGLNTAKKGTSIGKAGAIVMVPGLLMSLAGIEVGFASGGAGGFDLNPLLVGGVALTGGGAAAVYLGAAQAAYGTAVAHRALASGGAIPPFCGSCVLTFVALTPIPMTVWATVPISYLISYAKRNSLRSKYWAYTKRTTRLRVQPTLRISPIATRSGPGLGLAGEF
jgi:hypothetical protein